MITFTYRNYKGKTSKRRVSNAVVDRGDSIYHGKDVLLLKAFDLDKQAFREYLISDILQWDY